MKSPYDLNTSPIRAIRNPGVLRPPANFRLYAPSTVLRSPDGDRLEISTSRGDTDTSPRRPGFEKRLMLAYVFALIVLFLFFYGAAAMYAAVRGTR